MLRVCLICVGRVKRGSEREMTQRYMDRAVAVGRGAGLAFDVREIDESRARTANMRKEEEAVAIRAVAGNATPLLVLDEAGEDLTSASFSAILGAYRDQGAAAMFIALGGADGLASSLQLGAARSIAFGRMTWPHQLVRVMVCEQLYRAVTIMIGHPYHRA